MNVLVTGGCGFIFSNFIRYILSKIDVKIVNLDKLTYAANKSNLRDIEKNKNYLFYKGDVCDENLVSKIIKNENIDTIINGAAETHVDRSIVTASPFIITNVLGTTTLLEAARKFDVKKFIQIGTDEVYGSINEGAFTEESKLNPSSPYAASKAAADMVALSFFKTYGMSITITRSTNNFGPYHYPEKLIPKMIVNAILDKKLPVYGKGKNVRDWLFVEDNCRAINLILEKGKSGEIYNIAGENQIPNIEIVKTILNKLGKSEELIEFVKDRPGHDFRYSINCDKVKKLGWKPSANFNENLEKTIEWFKSNEWWWKKLLSKDSVDFHDKFN